MTYEEANKLARKIFIETSGDIYTPTDETALEEYENLNEAFTGGQPEDPCYHCARRNRCVYRQFIKNITGCNYRIVERH